MIRYALCCDGGHEHEAWFASAAEFDRLKEAGLLACPQCGSAGVSKQLMAPAVRPARKGADGGERLVAGPADMAVPAAAGQAVMAPQQGELAERLRELRHQILANTEDVGERFGEEARKIHYGESEQRGIRGKATLDEARELLEEGIEAFPLPALPEDHN